MLNMYSILNFIYTFWIFSNFKLFGSLHVFMFELSQILTRRDKKTKLWYKMTVTSFN